MGSDGDGSGKERGPRLRYGRPLVLLGAAALLCLASIAAVSSGPDPDGGAAYEELREGTEALSAQLQQLTEGVATIVRELSTTSGGAGSEAEAAGLRRVDRISEDAAAAADELRAEITTQVEKLRGEQDERYKQLQDMIKELPKDCPKGPPVREHPIGGGPAEGFAYYGADSGYGGGAVPAQSAGPPPDPCADGKADGVAQCRREEIKNAFLHSWKAYRKHAWGQDELRPLSKMAKNWGRPDQGMGLTILDAVSTLWMMDLKDEFEDVRKWVRDDMKIDIDFAVSAFEATIRIVGGLVSAYELSGEQHPEFLQKAQAVADRLLWAYNTSSGIPHANVNLRSHHHFNPQWTGGSSVLSEFGTVQLELRTLSYHTKNSLYDEKATWIMDIIEAKAPPDMLCPTYFNTIYSKWTSDHITLGALGDSFYEYLLKQYLLTGKRERRYKKMYAKAVKGIMSRLVKKSVPSGQTYLAEYKRGAVFNKMDHLACFAGGMLALGVHETGDAESESDDEAVMHVAEGLAETCYQMYHKQPTGVAPEISEFRGGGDMASGRAAYYLLRPEAIESFMYLWRFTKKQKYRDWGWEVFLAIKRWCRVDSGGYSGLRNVFMVPPQKDDLQQSFWLAETLKYLWILFSDDDLIDFSEWVLNTEAHPLKIRARDPVGDWPPDRADLRKRDLMQDIDERLRRHRDDFERRRAKDPDSDAGGVAPWQLEQDRIIREAREREQAQWEARHRKSGGRKRDKGKHGGGKHSKEPPRADYEDPDAERLGRLERSLGGGSDSRRQRVEPIPGADPWKNGHGIARGHSAGSGRAHQSHPQQHPRPDAADSADDPLP